LDGGNRSLALEPWQVRKRIMQSARYYEVEAQTIRREMQCLRNDERNRNLRQLLGRVARSYEEIAAELESGGRPAFNSP
jgi:hypothetical protein